MTARTEWTEQLSTVPADGIADFLTRNSGLPGPRGNLELADAFAEWAPAEVILELADSDDEYLRFCGTEAIGRLIREHPHDAALLETIRWRAGDERWRVREAAARALQIVGDADRGLLRRIVAEWVEADDALVQRAAIAAICEPRLLSDDPTRAAALAACASTTRWLSRQPLPTRRDAALRVLRQALGYCWSVAIAASPVAGISAFSELETSDDPDVAWIVASNAKKARLRRVLAERLGARP
ncbi:DNA alkylation repair protein [Lysinimonas soli]|uniref:DNA alkylation repair protein n=1 Tax=Lysinimonas soli TaxID=1074233 RepID=A0ABW0NN18_9MICO